VAREQLDHRHRARHRKPADQDRQQRRHHAAEEQQREHGRERQREALGLADVALGDRLRERLGGDRAADLDAREQLAQHRLDARQLRDHLRHRAGQIDQHDRAVAVARDERIEPGVVVGDRADHGRVVVELLERVEHRAHVFGVAHVAIGAVQHRDHVAVRDAEPLGESLRGAVRLAAGHVDAAREQLLRHVGAIAARDARDDQQEHRDRARPRGDAVAEPREYAHCAGNFASSRFAVDFMKSQNSRSVRGVHGCDTTRVK
jgi:hypothetical protein